MTTGVEFEAANITPPLKNTNGMICIAVIRVTPTSSSTDLSTLFGDWDKHMYTLQADGSKCYVAFGSAAGTIDRTATGTGLTVCWPIPDGTSLPVRLTSGRSIGSGIMTMLTYQILHHQSVATCTLCVYRSSLESGQGPGEFTAP